MSSAQPRTSCTKRSWWTARRSSTRRAVVAPRRRRRPSSPPDGARCPDSPSHFRSRSPTWTYMRSTAISGCRTCRGRKGCRTVAPVHPSIAVDLPILLRVMRHHRRTSSGSRDSARLHRHHLHVLFLQRKNTPCDDAKLRETRPQLSNFRVEEEFERCYFLKYYLRACEPCVRLYVTRRFGDDCIEAISSKSFVIFNNLIIT